MTVGNSQLSVNNSGINGGTAVATLNLSGSTNLNASTAFGSGTVTSPYLGSGTNRFENNLTATGTLIFNSANTNFQVKLTQGGIVFTNDSSAQEWAINNTNSGFVLAFALGGSTKASVDNAGTFSMTALNFNGQTAMDSDTYPNQRMPAPRYRALGNFITLSNVTAHGGVFTTNGVSTASSVAAGMTNGMSWSGMMSNAYQVAWMSNNVVTWKILAP